ncbi:hypothetical protein KAH94_00890 [bacterium]|nr:hypothetical protein [bacterium]
MSCFCVLNNVDLRYSISACSRNYWSPYFIQVDSWGCFFETLGEGLRKLVTYWYGTSKLHVQIAIGCIPVFIFGLFRHGFVLWKKEKFNIFSVGSLAFVLFFEMIILGVLKKYPFVGSRLTLFYAPFVFYLIVKAIDSMKKIPALHVFYVSYYFGFCIFCAGTSFLEYLKLYN